MARKAGHVTTQGSRKHLTQARFYGLLRAATRLVDSAAMLGTTPTGCKRIFAVDRGAMLSLAQRCDELRDVLTTNNGADQ